MLPNKSIPDIHIIENNYFIQKTVRTCALTDG